MNVLLLAGVGLAGFLGLWLVQTITLMAVGHDRQIAWPLRHGSDSEVVRWTLKGALQLVLASLIVGAPWLSGSGLSDYYTAMFVPARWDLLFTTMSVTLAMFVAATAMYLPLGLVTYTPHYGLVKSLGKLFRASLTPLPLAVIEETVFRGVVLEQFLRAWSGTPAGVVLSLTLSAAIFSGVHFIREQKRVLLPAQALFTLGFTLGLVYILSGHSLWIAVGIHAAGIWYTQLSRPFLTYNGPAWFVGYRSYPIGGVMGFLAMWSLVGWAYVVA
jgi:hypothetical protein